jgi:hypothetical protein
MNDEGVREQMDKEARQRMNVLFSPESSLLPELIGKLFVSPQLMEAVFVAASKTKPSLGLEPKLAKFREMMLARPSGDLDQLLSQAVLHTSRSGAEGSERDDPTATAETAVEGSIDGRSPSV